MAYHMVAGGFEYLIKVRVRDMITCRTFLREILVRLPGVRQIAPLYRYGRSQEYSVTSRFKIDSAAAKSSLPKEGNPTLDSSKFKADAYPPPCV
jgi:hypothetical protein